MWRIVPDRIPYIWPPVRRVGYNDQSTRPPVDDVAATGQWRCAGFVRLDEPIQGLELEEAELKARLGTLSQEHRDLDAAIDALIRSATADMLQIARLKKKKLRLKDEISLIQDLLIPDIIA